MVQNLGTGYARSLGAHVEWHASGGDPLKAGLSVIVLAFNEARNLPDLFHSIRRLTATVYVVDSYSTDESREIASQAGAVVVEHAFENYGVQRNWAQDNLDVNTEWVLHLDADERLTPELVEEINGVVSRNDPRYDGYMLRKRSVFLGKWIRHGAHYPSYHLRLYRKSRGRCENRLYDQHFLVDGPVGRLKHDYIDIITADLHSWSTRHLRWAGLEAREMVSASTTGQVNPRLAGNPIERRRWMRQRVYRNLPLFVRPAGYFLYRYVIRLGFLDGTEGLIFHFLQAFWYRFLVDAKIYEERLSNRPRSAGTKTHRKGSQ